MSTYSDPSFINHFTGDVLAVTPVPTVGKGAASWVAVGTPQASHVFSNYQGAWQQLTSYNIGDIIYDAISNDYYEASQNVPNYYPPTCLVTELLSDAVVVQ